MGRVGALTRSRLHSVFSGDASPVLALRVLGAEWSIVEWELTLTPVGGGATGLAAAALAAPKFGWADWAWSPQVSSFDLRAHTLAGLGEAIESAGFSVAYENTDAGHLGAIVLMEGAGSSEVSNGDHIHRSGSLLFLLLGALGISFEEARDSIALALGQMVLPDAGTIWADLFGSTCNVSRLQGEEDGDYTARIKDEVLRTRSSAPAMLRNIQRVTGEDLLVREPWEEIFTLSASRLCGSDHLQGAPVYQYHTMQVVSDHGGVDWPAVMAEAEADRPAGTIVLGPATHFPLLSFAASETAPAPVVAYRDDCRYRYVQSTSYGWTGAWDDRRWSVDFAAFPIGPPAGDPHLVAWWKMDEGAGSSLADSSGKDNTITLVNSPTWTTIGDETALSFDGADQSGVAAYSAELEYGDAMTAMCFYQHGGDQNEKFIFCQYDPVTNNRMWAMLIYANGFAVIVSKDGGGAYFKYYGSLVPMTTGTVYHLAFSWDAGVLRLYQNGVEITNITKYHDTVFSSVFGGNSEILIGASHCYETLCNHVTGTLRDARILTRVVSDAEIWAISQGYAI